MEKVIDIRGVDKASILMALYDAARPQGMGYLHFNPAPMTREQAERLLSEQKYFDYVAGRVMKIDLSGDELRPWLYDRDNGQGCCRRVLEIAKLIPEQCNA